MTTKDKFSWLLLCLRKATFVQTKTLLLLAFLSVAFKPANLFFCRSDAGDIDEADKFYKKAAAPYKPLLADVVKEALGNDNSMSDDVIDHLLQRSDILKELFAMRISIENHDSAGQMSVYWNLLTYLGNAR